LSYCPFQPRGFAPRTPLHRRSLAASPARSAPVARFAALARVVLRSRRSASDRFAALACVTFDRSSRAISLAHSPINNPSICNLQSSIVNRQICSLQPALCNRLLRLPMPGVFTAEAAELAQLEPFARLLLVLRRAVVAPLTLGARQGDDVSHNGAS